MTAESLAWLLIAFAPIDWLITWFVIEKAHRVREPSLVFTAGIFVAASILVTIGALLGFAYISEFPVPAEAYSNAIATAFLIPAVTPPLWGLLFVFRVFA